MLLNLPSPLLACIKLIDSSDREMLLIESDTVAVSLIESLSSFEICSCHAWEFRVSASSMASFKDVMRESLLTIFLPSLVAA